jgi:hypothetical protein
MALSFSPMPLPQKQAVVSMQSQLRNLAEEGIETEQDDRKQEGNV